MKTLITFRSLLLVLAAAAFAPVCLSAQVRPTFYGQPILDRASAVEQDGVDPVLAAVDQLARLGLDWQSAAQRAGMVTSEAGVLVSSKLSRVDDLSDVAKPGRRLWFYPGSGADIAGIEVVRMPVANSFGAIANEAEFAMKTDKYAASGLLGQGVRIAVIDIGFGGIDSNPETIGDSHRDDDLDLDVETHGTAMIELIRDIAPEAEVLPIRLDAKTDIIAAVGMAAALKADIIVCALSFFELPGMGDACEAAAMAAAQGMTWVNAAGNFGDRRYFEAQSLPEANVGGFDFLNFGDPYQFINGMADGDKFSVHLATDGKLQLELYRWDGLGSTFVLVAQGNPAADVQVVADQYIEGMYYFPMVRQLAPGQESRLRMFAVGCDLHFNVAQGSIANPVGGSVISVGAVHVDYYGEGAQIQPYSSIGGGIFKLELTLCGPTACTTGTHGPQGFEGTSASAANIAGLLALQMADKQLAADPLGNLRRIDLGGTDLALALVDDFEPDNSAEAATQLVQGIAAGHMISPSNDEDWFMFEVAVPSLVSASAGSCRVEIFDSKDGETADDLPIEKTLMKPGFYLVRVTSDEITNYVLAVDVAEPVDGEANIGEVVDEGKTADKGDDTVNLLLSAGQPKANAAPDAAGCAGNAGARGLALLLAVMLVSTGIVRARRRNA